MCFLPPPPTPLLTHTPTGANHAEEVVPSDCLLLAGSCIAEEAVLTGESTPQWKVPITDLDPNTKLNIKQVGNQTPGSSSLFVDATMARLVGLSKAKHQTGRSSGALRHQATPQNAAKKHTVGFNATKPRE